MGRAVAVALRWSGRALILAAVYVIVASLFFPEGVQALNPVVCPDGTELSNGVYSLPGRPDNAKLELVCTSPTYTESSGAKVVLAAVSLVAAGLLAIYVSHRMQDYRRPAGPAVPYR